MVCRKAEEQIVPYLLGALDSSEMSAMDHHVNTCTACLSKLREEGDIVTELAYAVPQVEAPARVKRALISRVEGEASPDTLAAADRGWRSFFPGLGLRFVASSGMVATLLLLGVLVVGGAWFNNRLSGVVEDKQELAIQIADVEAEEAEMMEMLKAQRYLTYMAASPDVSYSQLWGVGRAPEALGMVLVGASAKQVVLAVLDMPPLPKGKVYEVWLTKGLERYRAGDFTVDSTGYGQTIIKVVGQLSDFDAIQITVGYPDGSGASGESVLKGDL